MHRQILTNIEANPAPSVILIDAARAPGPQLALACARAGARVIAIGPAGAALRDVARAAPDRIEPLVLDIDDPRAFAVLAAAWGDTPTDLVVNLMPIAGPGDITAQVRALSRITRCWARGLARGKGRVISVVNPPADPLSLAELGLGAALNAAAVALTRAFARQGVGFETVKVTAEGARAVTDRIAGSLNPVSGSDVARSD